MYFRATLSFASLLVLAGCGSSGSDGGQGQVTPGLRVVIRGSTASFEHTDGLAGQTARSVTAGVRSLTLLGENGGADLAVLDADGSSAVTVGYDDGSQTVVGVVEPSAIVPGRYTRARMVQDWSRFEIDATLHADAVPTSGALRALHVTSDGAVVDGEPLAAGRYEHDFVAPEKSEHFSGDDATVAEYTTTAGAEAYVEGGLWAIYFPIDVTVTSDDAELVIVANMDRAFRWHDVAGAANQEGVYDILPPLYEPVAQFGANRFDVTYSPR